MNRHASQADRLLATVAWPGLHRIGAAIDDRHLGRPRQHPLAAHLAYGAAARIYRSCLAADRELAAGNLWARLIETYNTTADRLGHATMPARTPVMSVHRYRWARDLLTEPDILDTLLDAYTAEAVTLARTIGLLDPNGPGSLTHPHRSRIIYGDGTVVRPLYQPDRTKKKTTTGARRADPDAATFHRHDGPIHGNNLVAICARGDAPHERVVLAVGRVDEPGREADCALELIDRVVHHAGTGIQAVVYDGALRGVHIEQLMTRHGLTVINKVPAAAGGKDRELALGTFEHQPASRRRTCRHELIARAGQIIEVATDDTGHLIDASTPARRQVKRFRRPGGGWRFSLGLTIACRHGDFTLWLSPHPEPGDTTHRRPENVRLLAAGDDAFASRYGLRNDSESLNSAYKRTLLVDRANSLGWRRQLLDFAGYGILQNASAHAAHLHAQQAREVTRLRKKHVA